MHDRQSWRFFADPLSNTRPESILTLSPSWSLSLVVSLSLPRGLSLSPLWSLSLSCGLSLYSLRNLSSD
jgi:hypothetical protein